MSLTGRQLISLYFGHVHAFESGPFRGFSIRAWARAGESGNLGEEVRDLETNDLVITILR